MGGPSTWDQTKRNSLSVGDQDFHSVIESARAYRVGGIGREIKLNIGLSSPLPPPVKLFGVFSPPIFHAFLPP